MCTIRAALTRVTAAKMRRSCRLPPRFCGTLFCYLDESISIPTARFTSPASRSSSSTSFVRSRSLNHGHGRCLAAGQTINRKVVVVFSLGHSDRLGTAEAHRSLRATTPPQYPDATGAANAQARIDLRAAIRRGTRTEKHGPDNHRTLRARRTVLAERTMDVPDSWRIRQCLNEQ